MSLQSTPVPLTVPSPARFRSLLRRVRFLPVIPA
jgi:hypothetical protein